MRQAIAIELDHLSRNPLLPAYIISELNHHPERAASSSTQSPGAEPGTRATRVTTVLRRQIDARVKRGRHAADLARVIHRQPDGAVHIPVRRAADAPGDARAWTTAASAGSSTRRAALPAFFLERCGHDTQNPRHAHLRVLLPRRRGRSRAAAPSRCSWRRCSAGGRARPAREIERRCARQLELRAATIEAEKLPTFPCRPRSTSPTFRHFL